MASGWTGSLIAPNQRVHDATAMALDHVGAKDAHLAATNPAHPDHQSILASYVLRDPSLGSRTTGSNNSPMMGSPVGSASTFQNAGIPATINAAINNLGTNNTNSLIQQLLGHVVGNGAGTQTQVVTSPAQDEYFKSQTAVNNQRLAVQAAPGHLQNQISNNLASNPNSMGIMSIAPAMPGSYENSTRQANDSALQSLFGQFNAAKQAASGWTSPQF